MTTMTPIDRAREIANTMLPAYLEDRIAEAIRDAVEAEQEPMECDHPRACLKPHRLGADDGYAAPDGVCAASEPMMVCSACGDANKAAEAERKRSTELFGALAGLLNQLHPSKDPVHPDQAKARMARARKALDDWERSGGA